jgi:hypothetical protein
MDIRIYYLENIDTHHIEKVSFGGDVTNHLVDEGWPSNLEVFTQCISLSPNDILSIINHSFDFSKIEISIKKNALNG